MFRTIAAVGLAVAALAAAAAHAAVPAPTAIVATLNAARAANGIPAGITLVPDWSAKCRLHDLWMARNKTLAHAETPGSPGTTAGGNWAGTHGVIAEGASWADGNPFEHAPIHLAQLLAPQLAKVGADETGGYNCVTTWPGYTRTGTVNVVYTYPGQGRRAWRPSEVASELPSSPGPAVGIPEGTRTGPYLYVFADGPWLGGPDAPVLAAASLTGPGGPVALRTIDRRTKEVGPYFPPGSAVLGRTPSLSADQTYTGLSVASRFPVGWPRRVKSS